MKKKIDFELYHKMNQDILNSPLDNEILILSKIMKYYKKNSNKKTIILQHETIQYLYICKYVMNLIKMLDEYSEKGIIL